MDFGSGRAAGGGLRLGACGCTSSPGKGGLLAPRPGGLAPAGRKHRPRCGEFRPSGSGPRRWREKRLEKAGGGGCGSEAAGRAAAPRQETGAGRHGDRGKAGQAQGVTVAVTIVQLPCWVRLSYPGRRGAKCRMRPKESPQKKWDWEERGSKDEKGGKPEARSLRKPKDRGVWGRQ